MVPTEGTPPRAFLSLKTGIPLRDSVPMDIEVQKRGWILALADLPQGFRAVHNLHHNKRLPDASSDAILYFTHHLTNGNHIIGTQRIAVDHIRPHFSSPNMIKILCISTHGKGWKLSYYYPQIQALLNTYSMPGAGLDGGWWLARVRFTFWRRRGIKNEVRLQVVG